MIKRTKNIVSLALCLCILISLAACTRIEPLPHPLARISTITNAKALEAPEYGKRDVAATKAANGANDFAFRLSGALAENAGSENFVCSPYSVWLPLAALLNATDEEHRDALLAALGTSGVSVEDVNRATSRMLYDLTKLDAKKYNENAHNPLQIANAIFVDMNVRIKREFAQAFMDYFRGTTMNVDFDSKDAVDAVNQWASDNTDGLITDIIQEFNPDTVAAIANAIYFSDRWGWEFNPDETVEDTFHAPGGDITAFFMKREGVQLPYYEDAKVQAMPLYFKSGGGMYIILPKKGGATELLSSMDSAYFEKIQSGLEYKTGKLLLPRFSIESGVMDLKDMLIKLGVPLFDEINSPLTGGLIEENVPVWLSSAVQKAVIEVDEKGTTAAAVTVMAADATSSLPEPTKPFEMICDRPFVFILCEPTYDGGSQILFTGVVNRP